MALRMTDRTVNGVDVLDIEGRIVLGEESNAFREKVKSLLAAGKKKIVLNLAQVGYIDSAGLGTLVATFHSARSQGATLKLANLGNKVQGSPAGDQADDGFRHLRQRNSRYSEFQRISQFRPRETRRSTPALWWPGIQPGPPSLFARKLALLRAAWPVCL